METYSNYKGYGISYSTFRGKTTIDHFGMPLKQYTGLGESKGKEMAKAYIDYLTN